ncbi:hypothetical protein SAMN04488096_101406 [Mesonia phycicola]|uniref:Uncharacterized protein n=1 Tax=Mesonia phycicola TaxID=579105 RepID=A0A1M6ARP7_9FLAO|nr:hypothetical protein [Mesonia phycicola]SHI39008.1 hypothetical protein SAMN04488096_101406 [Mesonia phycicola]
MNLKCHPAPPNKKEYIADVGRILVKDYGKKEYYKPEEVKKASNKSNYYVSNYIDWHCWAMCIFSSHSDFETYHKLTGEACDYVAMKTEMLSGFAISSTANWFSISDIDIDASWLDFGSIFGGLLEGIGSFIGGIVDEL